MEIICQVRPSPYRPWKAGYFLRQMEHSGYSLPQRMLKLCRFRNQSGAVHAGLLFENGVLDLEPHHIHSLTEVLEGDQEMLAKLTALKGAHISLDSVELLAPVETQEICAPFNAVSFASI